MPKGHGGGSSAPHPKLNRIFCLYPLGQSVLSPTATSGLGLFTICIGASQPSDLDPESFRVTISHLLAALCSIHHPLVVKPKPCGTCRMGLFCWHNAFCLQFLKPIHRDLRALSRLQPVTNSYEWEFKGFVIPPSVLQI